VLDLGWWVLGVVAGRVVPVRVGWGGGFLSLVVLDGEVTVSSMADAKNRQSARARLRDIQARQRAVARLYERAVAADQEAEQEYAAAVARAEESRAAARRRVTVALAALAETVRDPQACAEIAGVTVSAVRHAAREATAGEVDSFLETVGTGSPRRRSADDETGRSGVPDEATPDGAAPDEADSAVRSPGRAGGRAASAAAAAAAAGE
jgi:hypothetical protein